MRRWMLPMLVALILVGLLTACRAPAPDLGPPPNVLLLVIDCLRADHLSHNGYKRPTTPNLDALAAESIRFTQAISQASWTRPSLPTLLTGLYPSEHGLHSYDSNAGGKVTSPSLAESVTTVAEALKSQGYRTALIGEQFQLSPRFGLNQGFDFYKNRASDAANIQRNFFRWLQREVPEQEGEPPTEEKDARFFAYLHYLEIHWPYCPPKEVRGTFDEGKSEIRFCRNWRQLRKDIVSGNLVLTEDDRQAVRARYDEELLALDAKLGELFTRLKRRKLWDDTLIIVTSDHGEEFWEHGSTGHGQSLYGELINVPLLFKPPAGWPAEKGRQIDALVELRQVTPTVLAAVGAPPLEGVAATSLLPWMVGAPPTGSPADYVVAEDRDQVAIRSENWKLVAQRDGGHFELYDLVEDPRESRDLTRDRRGQLQRLRGYFADWKKGLKPLASVDAQELDPETVEGLKALGYIDG